MNRDELSATTHAGLAFANPFAESTVDAAVAALELPSGACVLDIGCGNGELLARIAAVHDAKTVGVVPSSPMAALARDRVGVLHEARLADVDFEPASFDLVCCIGSSHAFGSWEDGLRGLAGLVRQGGGALVGEGFWRRTPGAGYLEALGGATVDELPDHTGLLDGVERAGWQLVAEAVASDEDWAAYEETLIANGRRALAASPDEELRAWVDAAEARWNRPDGRDTLGFALMTLRRTS